jgi:polyribonucleotide nucleotidyltransferase
MNIHSVSVEVGGRPLTFEVGKLAKQTNGSIVVKQDDSMVLMTACASKSDSPFDFLPLTVVYQDRTASFGKIPGGFLKSEGRPNERETLISRLIDRPIRPQFPKHFRREMQLIATVLSFDPASDTDVLSLCGGAAAFAVSDIPMEQPVAGVRIVRVKGEYIINPSLDQTNESDLALIVAGSREGICMVEGGANEADEESMMEAMELAFVEIQKIIGAIEELQAKVNPTKFEIDAPEVVDLSIKDEMVALGLTDALTKAMATEGKFERGAALKTARNALIEELNANIEDEASKNERKSQAKEVWSKTLSELMRSSVVEKGIRIDGRATDEIRDIWIEVGVAPRAHGSTVFTRGETQGFVTATLGVDDAVQRVDFANESGERRWMLQYNFPPFCVGEVRRMGGPKRREVGHGKLAWRALLPMLPIKDDFPYVIRCSSDILESNGSSSMATVCGATLAMLDAGVPLKESVAGIAMGLIKEGDNYVVLSDILGDEDHLGDMDFKVTGTVNGITAFQMDTKIGSIPREVMNKAMTQAKDGRLHILNKMEEVIAAPRDEMSPFAPRIHTMYIKQDKIREVIGPGGRVIRSIQDECNVRITTYDDGRLDIAATSDVDAKKAESMIETIVQEPEVGKIYLGLVKKIEKFGAFVEILPGAEGLVHISEMANERVGSVRDVVNEGDEIYVKVIPSDRSGKLSLSRKQALGEGV